MRLFRAFGALALGLALSACDGGAAPADARPPEADAGPWYPEDLPVVAWGTVDPADPGGIDPATAAPADFSCLGMVATRMTVAPVRTDVVVNDFQTGRPVPGLCIRGFPNDAVTDAGCDASAGITDVNGRAFVEHAANGWGTLDVLARPDPDPAIAFARSLTVNATGNIAVAISGATLNLVPTVLGRSRVEGSAILGSLLLDCAPVPHAVYGVVFRVARADGSYIDGGPARGDPRYAYSNGRSLPLRDQRWTHVDGGMFAVNLPVPSDGSPVFLEAWGRLTDGAPPTLLACERGRIIADGVTLFYATQPLRSDPPPCPGLSSSP